MTDRDILIFSIGLLSGLLFAGIAWLIDLHKRSDTIEKGNAPK